MAREAHTRVERQIVARAFQGHGRSQGKREDAQDASLRESDDYFTLPPSDPLLEPPRFRAWARMLEVALARGGKRTFLDQLWLFLTGLGVALVMLVVGSYWQSWKEFLWHWFDLHFKR